MPTLHWIGKDKVVNHHLDVPYKILEHQYTYKDQKESKETLSENKIIHGDNLEALKSLLPEYEGKIKCIYIDPPYNTGNENWVYNDNVSHPKLQKWLGEVVGKESEDLSRHDKWLCMMYPRLKLLHKLMAENGAIFISIDDTEVHFLCLILDEIFGKNNFSGNIVWQKRTSPDARATLGAGHEHIIVYSKNWNLFRDNLNKIPLNEKQVARFKNPDNDLKGKWVSSDFTAQGFRPNQMYSIKTPSGKTYSPPEGRCWKNIESVYLNLERDGRMWYGKDGNGVPRRKTYLNEREGIASWTWWTNQEVGHSQEGKQEVNAIFNSATIFDTPKPSRLIERICNLYLNDNDIMLDSFAGSGTTAHAVLNLNKKDGGKRKFILVEMEDYATTITSERVKRVINGYGEGNKAVEGTDGDFSYYELGKSLFLENDLLNEDVELGKIQEYLWYSETKSTFKPQLEEYLLGINNSTAYYFYYNKEGVTTLDESFLRRIKTKAEQYIVYSDNCLLDEKLMNKYHIIFKKIPRDISRF